MQIRLGAQDLSCVARSDHHSYHHTAAVDQKDLGRCQASIKALGDERRLVFSVRIALMDDMLIVTK